MALKVKRTGNAEYGQYIKALICGDPGAGKTLISSTFPNPLYASAEGGLMSIASRNIPYVDIKESMDLLGIKAALEQSPAVREKMFGFPVDTVVIDTIDEIQRILIRERNRETRKDSMELRDWGWLGDQMQAIVSGFRNLDMNVVMTCHLREQQDSEHGGVWFEPGLQGAIGKQIAAYFDLALLLDVQTKTVIVDNKTQRVQQRFLITSPDPRHSWIKDRSGKLPVDFSVNFEDDYKRLHEAIYGDITLPSSTEEVVDTPIANTVAQAVEEVNELVSTPSPEPSPVVETVVDEEVQLVDVQPIMDIGPVEEEPVRELDKALEPEVPVSFQCSVCEADVLKRQADMSRIRFREILCKTHFDERKRK